MNRVVSLVGLSLFAALLSACNGTVAPATPAVAESDHIGLDASGVPLTTESVLYTFLGSPDGSDPYASLTLGQDGDFYGTTRLGGTAPSGGLGTVFKIDGSGNETILHSFTGTPDGSAPEAGVIFGTHGELYGDTTYGGNVSACPPYGCGIVYTLLPKKSGYQEKIIYTLQGGPDGDAPIGTLLVDRKGVLYGTTIFGGGSSACTGGCGVIFKVVHSKAGFTETVLHRFQGGSDGASPVGTLIEDARGNLYGTTKAGGNAACSGGCGTVFRLATSGAGYRTLYAFQGGNTDGANARSGLRFDKQGRLFGATQGGGPQNLGTVYELTASGTSYTERMIYAFSQGGKFGAFPKDESGLYFNPKGAIYGTTLRGGSGPSGGYGTAFKLTPSGSNYKLALLHKFQGGSDAAYPASSLTLGTDGLLYGTASFGGVGPCSGSSGSGCGVVYKVAP